MRAIHDSIRNFLQKLNRDGGRGYFPRNINFGGVVIKHFVPRNPNLNKDDYLKDLESAIGTINNINFKPVYNIDELFIKYSYHTKLKMKLDVVEFVNANSLEIESNFEFVPPEAMVNDFMPLINYNHFRDSLNNVLPNLFVADIEVMMLFDYYIEKSGLDIFKDKAYINKLNYKFIPNIFNEMDNVFKLRNTLNPKSGVNKKILMNDMATYLIKKYNYPHSLSTAIVTNLISGNLHNNVQTYKTISNGFNENGEATTSVIMPSSSQILDFIANKFKISVSDDYNIDNRFNGVFY